MSDEKKSEESKTEEKRVVLPIDKRYAELGENILYSAWRGHEGFAWWVSDFVKPKVTVDLGVDWGYSTFVLALPQHGTTYGIDWFKGDPHAGHKDTYPKVMEIVDRLIDRYGCKIEIIKADFLEEAKTWNKKIDLMHLDGFHSYEQCKKDYDAWSPHLTESGVMLMHDTVSYPGVRRVFDEAPMFKANFVHSYGLGVLSKDRARMVAICDRYGLTLIEPRAKDIKGTKVEKPAVVHKAIYGGVDVTLKIQSMCFPLELGTRSLDELKPKKLFGVDPLIGFPKDLKVWYGPDGEPPLVHTIKERDHSWTDELYLTGKVLMSFS